MIRIAALNDSNSESDSEDGKESLEAPSLTKEAVENAAYSLYNKGLAYERAGSIKQAIQSFELLLSNDFVKQPVVLSDDGQQQPSSLLKYSALKNLAKLHSQQGKHHEAIGALLQAVEIDFTDVSVSYRLGILARKLDKFVLASSAFQKGLELSPGHWPCLDNLLTLLYALDNYEACLCHIANSLVRDSGYVKALVLRKLIYKEQPCLEKEFSAVFSKCDMEQVLAYTDSLESQEENEVIEEVNAIRDTYRDQCKPKPPPIIKLELPELSWLSLGRRLLELYTDIEKKSPEQNHCCSITMNIKPRAPATDRVTGGSHVDSVTVQDVTEFSSKEGSDLSSVTIEVKQGSDSSQCTLSALSMSSADNSLSDHKYAAASESSCDKRETDDLVAAVINEMVDKVEMLTAAHADTAGSVSAHNVEAVKEVLEHILSTVDDRTPDIQVQQVISDMVSQVVEAVDNDSVTAVQGVIDLLVSQVIASVAGRDDSPSPVDVDHIYAIASGSETHMEQEKAKKSRVMLEQKRRSARVKPSAGKQAAAESIGKETNYYSQLEDAVPKALLEELTSEYDDVKLASDLMDTGADASQPNSTAVSPLLFENEASDVRDFLSRLQTNMGVIHVMREWLYSLCDLRMYTWSPQLISTYMKVYDVHRPCYQMPNIFSSSPVERDAMSTLVWMELKVDSIDKKSGGKVNLGRDFEKEFTYWEYIIGTESRLPNVCKEYSLRYYYMASLYFVATKQLDDAVVVLRNLLDYAESLTDSDMKLVLHNTTARTVLTREKIEGELQILERSRSLSQLQSVYDNEDFGEVISLLAPTFELPLSKRCTESRFSQLQLLLDTIGKLKNLDQPIKWLADVLQEIVHYAGSGHVGSWTDLTISALTLIDNKLDMVAVEQVCTLSRTRLAKSCLAVIRVNVTAIEASKAMPVKTVLPWIILSKLINMHDSSHANTLSGSPSSCLPPWLESLVQSHKFLATYNQCTCFKGALLQYMLKRLLHLLSGPDCNNRQQLEQHINQCIFCLYSHPNKKIKARHLCDHGSPTVPLTWPVAQQLFEYYRPKSVPDFDSYKSSTISAELEHLLKRLVNLVPTEQQPDPMLMSTVDSYLAESASLKDLDELRVRPCNSLCSDAFYLLADYYFKNKEPLKATKHYIQDLYYQPNRFDSWAGMALAKSSKLESRLGLMEKQSYDGAFQKLAVSTVQSFNRALQLNHDNVKLWIEYACSAYQLHSFASRVIKSRKSELPHPDMSTFTQLRKDMLAKSKQCYTEASLCNDDNFEEEWLHHYMLGKIGEKLQEDPSVYLKHYIKAAKCLDSEGAQYPAKISYMYNPPYLAVEALEMYYRVHASILKSLQRNEATSHYQLFTEVLSEMKTGSFASAQVPSSPCTPVGRKRKIVSDSVEKVNIVKRRKSESELSSPAQQVKIATRRREKLRVDGEIVKELLDDLVTGLVSLEHQAGKDLITSDLLTSEPCTERSPRSRTSTEGSPVEMEVGDSEVSLTDEKMETELMVDVKYAVVRLVDIVEEQMRRERNRLSPAHAVENSFATLYGAEASLMQVAGNELRSTAIESVSAGNSSSAVENLEGRLVVADLPRKRKLDELARGSRVGAGVPNALYAPEDIPCKVVAKHASAYSFSAADAVARETQECLDDMLDRLFVGSQPDLLTSRSSSFLSNSVPPTSPPVVSGINPPHFRYSNKRFSMSSTPSPESPMIAVEVSSVIESASADGSLSSQSFADDGKDLAEGSTPHQPLSVSAASSVADTTADVSEIKDSLSPQLSDLDVAPRQTSPTTSLTATVATVGELTHDAKPGEADTTSSGASSPHASDDICSSIDVTVTATNPISVALATSITTMTSSTDILSVTTSMSTGPTSSETITSASATSAPATSALVTSAPATSAPATSAPATSAPATSAPATSAPATSAPATSTPATSAPATSASATSAPATSASATSAPATSAPATSAPATSAPATSAPATSASATSAPATSAPATSAPATSTPATSAPATSASATSAPATSASATSAPATSAPATSALATSAPATSASATSAPATSAPATSASATSAPATSAPATSSPVMALSRDELTEACIAALKLCVQRYPLHYKSYFRLAKTFLHDSQRKDLDKVQDLLLGNTSKKAEDKFVAQGLFQDRKHNNFFNGVWRIPVQEIERAGSFGAHLYKTIYLLLQFLHEKRDYHLLYQLHSQLQRTPDAEKKFLKDVDRLLLASKAMEFAIHSLYKVIGADAGSKGEYNYAASLHQSYKWFNYCNKNSICVPNAQVLLIKAYKSYKKTMDEAFEAHTKMSVAEAKEFCQQLFSGRCKDKSKAADSRQAAGEPVKLHISSQTVAAKTSRGSPTTHLPSVRGSFLSFDGKKAKLASTKLDLTSSVVTLSSEKPPSSTVALPSSSWMNKAKDGTAALASMFTKPKTL